MLSFVGGDMRDRGKDIAAVSSSTLDAVSVVDATLASFVVDIKIPEVVVKVDGSSTKVTSEQGSVGGEDGGDVDMTLAAEGDAHTCEPFVEVGNNRRSFLMCHKLWTTRMKKDEEDSWLVVVVVVHHIDEFDPRMI